MANIFFDIGAILIIATAFAFIAKLLKQPLIPAYIFTGLIIGPFLGLIKNSDVIITLSEIGIAFLLFIVGLEINIKKLTDVGVVSTIGGLTQILSIFTISFIIAILLSFTQVEAIYVGLILAFSSTMIVLKLLSDKRQIDTLHGRIVIGFLLLQDIAAIFVLSVLTTLSDFSILTLFLSIIKGFVVIIIAILAGKYLFPKIFAFAAKSRELLFMSAVSISFLFSILFNLMGFSIAIGAFVAGVTLANLPYNIEIIGKVKSLRDFFSILFFVSLGMELLISSFKLIIKPLIIFLIIVIIVKPLVIMFLCSFFGYKKRTSFMVSSSLAQISEFSLIIVAQGMILGHISREIFSLTVLLAVITITLTSYLIKFDIPIYLRIKDYLNIFDKINMHKGQELEYLPRKSHEVILVGYNRVGFSIVKTLKKLNKKMLVIDFNPETISRLIKEKIPCMYGDIGDLEIIERLNFKKAKLIISTIPTKRDNLLLIRKAREINKSIVIFVTADQVNEALSLYDAGADYVILPHLLGGEHASLLIERLSSISKVLNYKIGHIKELKERHALGHEHPAHHPNRR